MAMVINTNVMSLNAQRNLTKSQEALGQTMERLSSGLRINSAKDDAAGSAISSKLTSQIRGFDQSIRNANDGISLVQTADGALSESSNILQRMRELSVQSANGTYSSGNRTTLNAETQQLIKELDRIATSTNFNGLNLLDGSASDVKLHIGANENETMTVSIGKLDAESLGVEDTAGLSSISRTATSVSSAAASISDAFALGGSSGISSASIGSLGSGDLIINGITIDGAKASSDTASAYAKEASAIATAAAINEKSAQTGVTAVVGETQVGGSAMSTDTAAAASGTIQINGVSIALQLKAVTNSVTASADNAANRQSIVEAINLKSKETGVTAIDTGIDNNGITLVAEDGRNIAVYNSGSGNLTAANTGLSIGGTGTGTLTTGTVTLVADRGKDIEITSTAEGKAMDAGFTVGTYSGTATQVSSRLNDSTTAMTAGNLYVNGVSVGPSYATDDTASNTGKEYSAIAKAAAFNLVSDKTGVTAVVNKNTAENTAVQGTVGASVGATINGVSINTFMTVANDMTGNRQRLVAAINEISDRTGVRAIDTGVNGSTNGGGVQLVAEDGRNIVVDFTNTQNAGFQSGAATFVGEFTLTSDKEIVIERGSNSNMSYTGMAVGEYGGGEDGMAIKNIDISTVDGANKAITAIDNALERVNNVRADLGAVNNRLDFAVNNLSSISNNASAARSRIADTDFASETAKLSRSQVLMQASQAMLAQANSQPQQVMSLLR